MLRISSVIALGSKAFTSDMAEDPTPSTESIWLPVSARMFPAKGLKT